MASPAPDTNGISTPPATASAAHTNSPPPSSATQPTTTTTAPAPAPTATTTAPTTEYPPSSLLDTGKSKRPRDARLLHLLLSHMGVTAYTERVPLQLLDYAYRYTSSILSDALSYDPPPPSNAPGEKGKKRDLAGEEVGLAALRTAISARAVGRAAGGKEVLGEIAMERNRVALPRVEREFGVRLPGERWCFTGVGWGVGAGWEEEVDEEEEEEERDVGMGGVGGGGGFGEGFTQDTEMGGMDEEEVDEDEFKAVMG